MNASQARRVWAALADPSLLSEFGIRSASSAEKQYTNADYVTPYSNIDDDERVRRAAAGLLHECGDDVRRAAAALKAAADKVVDRNIEELQGADEFTSLDQSLEERV